MSELKERFNFVFDKYNELVDKKDRLIKDKNKLEDELEKITEQMDFLNDWLVNVFKICSYCGGVGKAGFHILEKVTNSEGLFTNKMESKDCYRCNGRGFLKE